MLKDIILKGVLKRVKLARQIIKAEVLEEDFITEICGKLGFNDTAFREKSAKGKLMDFLLDKNYWVKRLTNN